jgi:hypothetical protein
MMAHIAGREAVLALAFLSLQVLAACGGGGGGGGGTTFTLTVAKAGAGTGTITSSPTGITCGSKCSADFGEGKSVTLTATPDAASAFAGWSGDCSGTSTCVLTMSAAHAATATFAPTVTVTKAGLGNGSVTSTPAGIDCGTKCSADFGEGKSVTLTAIPDAASAFAGWSGDCSGTSTCVLTMSAAHAATATFDGKPTGTDTWHAQNAGRTAVDLTPYVATTAGAGRFALVASGAAAPLVVNTTGDGEYAGVVRAVSDLRSDINKVTGVTPTVANSVSSGTLPVLIGTRHHSPIIDGLVTAGKLDATGLDGKWETWHTQIVSAPTTGVASALVIAGSDQRGTIYGIYDLSRQIGVSPWYFWDDVQPAHQDALYVLPGVHTLGQPAVKYRGFFINDEAPALDTWYRNYFATSNGVFKHDFYAKMFELLLRLRGNYLWPAVWGRAFDLDDTTNHATAQAYGIVMGTSHEAPMDRGIEEWNRRTTQYGGNGQWSFRTNADAIIKYWTAGIDRMVAGKFEDVVTVGMRGNGDTGLIDGTALPLMESILSTERNIIASETGLDPTAVPQVWTLYKEVLGYWDRGLRAPADVTIIFPDDNWGNMRALPNLSDSPRSGGYGVYYHFDYVGGSRNYKWVDTNLVPNIWEQLNLAYTYGVDRLWMVNGGDVKGNERPIQFFLDLAWSPETWTVDALDRWSRAFAQENFGSSQAATIASLLDSYERLQSRRKPELLNRLVSYATPTDLAKPVYNGSSSPFSLVNYRELESVVDEWTQLRASAEAVNAGLGTGQQAAFYQLVLYPIAATENAYRLRLAGFRNKLYAAQGRASTYDWAAAAQARFADDQAMSTYHSQTLSGGKWKGFQTESKFGYGGSYADSSWQSPAAGTDAIWPVPITTGVTLASGAGMGVAIDGSESYWTTGTTSALPALSSYSTSPAPYLEVFSRGSASFSYTITPSVSWITVSNASGTISTTDTKEIRAEVSVNSGSSVPSGTTPVNLVVAGNGQTITVPLSVVKPAAPTANTFVEAGGYVSMRADHTTALVAQNGVSWLTIPNIGRADPYSTSVGLTPTPSTSARVATPGGATPHLEYDMTLYTTGTVRVWVYLSPRNNVLPTRAIEGEGLKYGISIDGETPQVVNIQTMTGSDDAGMNNAWGRNTGDNTARVYSSHTVSTAGKHALKFWMVDPTVVLQKVVVDTTGALRDSYLGPPESFRNAP